MRSKKLFELNNLDCTCRAGKIEEKVSLLDGVRSAKVDTSGRRLVLSYDAEPPETFFSDLEQAVKSVNPAISLSEAGKDKRTADKGSRSELIRLIATAAVYAAGMAVSAFKLPDTAVFAVFAVSLIISGAEVFVKAGKNMLHGKIFDENFLMAIASIGAFAINKYAEGAAVLLFYQIGEFFEDTATEKSKKSITDLMDLRPDYANLIDGGKTVKVSPENVHTGNLIEIKPYEKIPFDGEVVSGVSFVDTSGITGEPVPREASAGSVISGGFVNGGGTLTVKVLKEYGESTVAKIIDLVENSSAKKAKAENFITKFARIYTPAVTLAALLIAVIPPAFFHIPFWTSLYRAIIFLVVSCPCALVVSVPLGFFAGIGAASYNGILVKGGNYLEKLGKVKNMVFDKTGTLTQGVFKVTQTVCAENVTRSKLLETAALSQSMSSHPIAKSISAAVNSTGRKLVSSSEIAGMGVISQTDGSTIVCGNEKLMEREHIAFTKCNKKGTLVYVAENGRYLGCIVISDIVKKGSAKAVKNLRSLGVKKTVMLTGDRQSNAEDVAQAVGIDVCRAGLLPDQKAEEFEKIAKSGITAYAGDGINDAPVLAMADVGIAMGGIGSDAAVEAADIVIMDDNPERIATAVRISRYVRAVVYQNIVLALGIKFAVLILGAAGIAGIWAAVFADTGVALLAVLNSMRILLNKRKFADRTS